MNLPDSRDRFLALSGVEPQDLRERAAEPELLGSVLDFLLADDALLSGFCDDEALESRDIHMARLVLAG